MNQTFSFDEETVKKLEAESKILHLGKSAFLRYLIWSYHRGRKQNITTGGW